ncbi:MAG: AMP-binding protein, partial [bacterium]|nr:AMP-binding protein [bacterium]
MNNPGAIALPLDHLRGATPSYRGARCPMALPPPLSAAVDELSEQQALTRSTVLLAAFKALLVRISGQDDIAVGFAGPPAAAAGVLVLRTDLGGDPGFRELLKRVAAVVREAREHRVPSFQVLFELRTTPPLAQRLADTGGAGCDLTLSLPEDGSGGHGYFEYNAELFDATTILRLRAHFTTLLAAMVAAPEQRLSSPDLLTPAEHHQLLVEWRGRIPPVIPEASTLYELFAAQAERRPDAVAMVSTGTDRRLSYGQLDERSNQLAHHLRALGVGRDAGAPETVVGIAAERGPEVVVGLLGILKAGGVYLPLDPAHPADRLAFMLGDAGARVLLVGESVAGRLPPAEVHGAQVVSLDGPDAHVLDREPTASPELGVDSDALAYVIYTSGTTGVPKGVAVSHRQVLPVHSWFLHYFALGAHTRVLQNLSHCFDFGLFELVTTLLAGGTLCFVPEEERGDLGNYHQAIERHALNTVHTTPSWFRELMVRGRLPGLEIVHLGGEAIGRELMPEIEA